MKMAVLLFENGSCQDKVRCQMKVEQLTELFAQIDYNLYAVSLIL